MRDYWPYIGKPFEYGGRGPDSYDCYGLVLELLRKDGLNPPDLKTPSNGEEIIALFHSEIPVWKETDLTPGAVLVFRVPGNMHVGYYLGNDRFIHVWENTNGVTIERLSLWRRRLLGVYTCVN